MLYEVFEVRQGRRKKYSSFNPNREYLEKATKRFLKIGGTITKLKLSSEVFDIDSYDISYKAEYPLELNRFESFIM